MFQLDKNCFLKEQTYVRNRLFIFFFASPTPCEPKTFSRIMRCVKHWTAEKQEQAWILPDLSNNKKRTKCRLLWNEYALSIEGLNIRAHLPGNPSKQSVESFIYLWSQQSNDTALYGISCKMCPLPWIASENREEQVRKTLESFIVIDQLKRTIDHNGFPCWEYFGSSPLEKLKIHGRLICAYGYPVHVLACWPKDQSVNSDYFFDNVSIR